MSLPIVVTHPYTLFHDGLRQIFSKSRFRPVRIAVTLSEDLEKYLGSLERCVWLTGIDECIGTTNALIRKTVSANPGVKAVILSAAQRPEDIMAALRAGASGFLCQAIPCEQLLRSLELIALGEMVVHPQLDWTQTNAREPRATGILDDSNEFHATKGGGTYLGQYFEQRSPHSDVAMEGNGEGQIGDVARSLSRREILILRMLTEGASNKVIARKLVITESTVKVHMKAILRKLRLQNRTQAALWARNHVKEGEWNNPAASAGPTH